MSEITTKKQINKILYKHKKYLESSIENKIPYLSQEDISGQKEFLSEYITNVKNADTDESSVEIYNRYLEEV